jgi:alkanesulfonate monooxygenase SsuD/methylene tetrahydromethanopterin reductase-like flavin-dependent oxidoreductase (luciferase family)
MDEMIHIIRGLSTGEYFGWDSEYYKIPRIKLCPVPTAPVPILLGGHTEPALRRAGRLCDGWISANSSLNELGDMMARINTHREAAGRADLPFEMQVMCAEAYSPDGILRLEEMGVTEVLVGFRDAYAGGEDPRTLESMIAEINYYAETVIQKAG